MLRRKLTAAIYFASSVQSARRAGYTDARLARHVDLRDVAVVEAYAGR